MTLSQIGGNTLTLKLEPFLARINRKLRTLTPYRELFYDKLKRDYYIRVVNLGQPDHLLSQGPYYYSHMIGLARHLNLFNQSERLCSPILLQSRSGTEYQEARLPGHLKFNVLTPVLKDAMEALRSAGYTITPPAPVTAPVTPEPELLRAPDPQRGGSYWPTTPFQTEPAKAHGQD